jgi:hypothetical protein
MRLKTSIDVVSRLQLRKHHGDVHCGEPPAGEEDEGEEGQEAVEPYQE